MLESYAAQHLLVEGGVQACLGLGLGIGRSLGFDLVSLGLGLGCGLGIRHLQRLLPAPPEGERMST